jgi:hypothetical protein
MGEFWEFDYFFGMVRAYRVLRLASLHVEDWRANLRVTAGV